MITIGHSQPCFIVAEAGINHNGDINLAHQLIDYAEEVGVDAIKFQYYKTEDFLLDKTLTHKYTSQGKSIVENQYNMFKRYELSYKSIVELSDHAKQKGLIFFCTPTSEKGISELIKLGVPLLKNGSDYLGNLPMIRTMARTGLPVILSTGMATWDEIDDAVQSFQEADGKDLILLHCTSTYPTPSNEVNLRRISALSSIYNCPVGFSDHTQGTISSIGAVVMGACMIEKHFTLDKKLSGPDHRFSADPKEMEELVNAIRTVEQNMGSGAIKPTPSEIEGRSKYRLSCVAKSNLPANHRLIAKNIIHCRPGTGILPKEVYSIIGKRLINAVDRGHIFKREDLK